MAWSLNSSLLGSVTSVGDLNSLSLHFLPPRVFLVGSGCLFIETGLLGGEPTKTEGTHRGLDQWVPGTCCSLGWGQ